MNQVLLAYLIFGPIVTVYLGLFIYLYIKLTQNK
jgi:hypothetical protein